MAISRNDTATAYQHIMCPPKANKVLKIVGHLHDPNDKRTGLFSLPTELREVVYKLVLSDSPLWYRRHKKGCLVRRPEASQERPVWQTTIENCNRQLEPHSNECCSGMCDHLTSKGVAYCRKNCWRRDSLGLLRACWQIYEEANPVFWLSNMICFTDIEEFLAIMESIPKAALWSIRRLSLLQIDQRTDPSARPYNAIFARQARDRGLQKDLYAMLTRMIALRELELSPEFVEWYPGPRRLRQHRTLQTIRCVMFQTFSVTNPGRKASTSKIYMRVAQEMNPLSCLSVAWHEIGFERGCYATRSDEDVDEFWELDFWNPDLRRMDSRILIGILEATVNRLRYTGAPAQGENDYHTVALRFPSGRTPVVGLFGLPVHTPESRTWLYRFKVRMLSSEGSRFPRQEAKIVEVDSLEFESLTLGTEKERKAVTNRTWPVVKYDAKVMNREKEKSNKMVARQRYDAVVKKEEVQKEREKVKRSAMELAEQKQALKKRAARRAVS